MKSSYNPSPPQYFDSSWRLISQGAEARVWCIPNFISIQLNSKNEDTGAGSADYPINGSASTSTTNNTATHTDGVDFKLMTICKERFKKSYRHSLLDVTLTKSRTKSELRSLVRCRRAGVSVPVVYGVDLNGLTTSSSTSHDNGAKTSIKGNWDDHKDKCDWRGACLFLEYIHGKTVREYLESRTKLVELDTKTDRTIIIDQEEEPEIKKARHDHISKDNVRMSHENHSSHEVEMKQTVTIIDKDTIAISREIGIMLAKMHDANIVHGDLTTSNIMIRTATKEDTSTDKSDNDTLTQTTKKITTTTPKLVLIDFGLSTNAASSHEEKAVDLYVLERAFETTHPGSELLVQEILRAYKGKCKHSDSVLQRLSQVRSRGRKRECFG